MHLQRVCTRAPLRRSHARAFNLDARAHSSSKSPLPTVWHDTGAALRHSHPHLVAAGALVPGGFSAAEFAARRAAVRASLHAAAASALPPFLKSTPVAPSLPPPSCTASASSSSPSPPAPAASRPLRAALLVPSQPESRMANDMHFPYRASSDQLWLTGFTEPDCLTVVQSDGDQCQPEGHDADNIANAPFALLVRERNPLREQWDGARAGTAAARALFGADACVASDADGVDARAADEALVQLALRNDIIFMDESVNPAWSARLRAAIARAAVAANETAAADISANADASAGVNANNSTTPSASVASSASASISSSTNSSARASAIAIASPSATTIRTGIAQLLPPPPALIAAHRAVKSPTELNAMRAAAKISADAFCDLMRRTHAGVSEDRLRHGGREEGEPFFEEFIMNFPFLDKIKIATNHF